MTTLVGFASAHGSTAEIAERIGAGLRARHVEVDVRAVEEVGDPSRYSAFVLGSAVHDMAWLPQATDFVAAHEELLVRSPVWVFSVGMPAALRGPWKVLAPREEQHVVGELLARLRPHGHALFSGVVAEDHLPPAGRAIFRAMGLRFGDYRDWDAVDAFAADVARALSAGPPPEPS
ncbi:flavodoxin domain-containing protein [Streptomyces chumphonensis]|uniref:flavodoxin domain-containing protein n=1 Tax=Streptomyces chumphonensis TaxID=1214925 RepID=UPI003D73D115